MNSAAGYFTAKSGRSHSVLIAVTITLYFLWIRPLNSPWHPYIAGDGLGYYAYLPATFIYHDANYEFKWFNAVHDSNYVYSTFENPEDNLLVNYGDRKINKYYQGLSFIWMPFFFAGHAVAKIAGYRADGFSPPYQAAMAMASLFYLLTGVIYLRKLLLLLSGNPVAATVSALAVFFGTHLCNFGVFANTLSHAYSFTFTVLFLYALSRYEASLDDRDSAAARFFFIVGATIRPLNALLILLAPAFVTRSRLGRTRTWGWRVIAISSATVAALGWTLYINYRQTGTLFAYNYAGEKFDFAHPKFADALISYHQGLFTYVPLVLLSLFGIPFLDGRKRWMLPVFFFSMLFLYSCWWYWPITKRALVDFYALPAVMLAALLARARKKQLAYVVVVLCIAYYQLKAYQVRKGVLDENATYGEVFWRHFFRTTKANIYPIAPATIIKSQAENIDLPSRFPGKAAEHEGRKAYCLSPENYIATFAEAKMPPFFSQPGFRKIRLSFDCLFEEGARSMHVFMQFYGHDDKMILEVPFYLNEADISYNKWDRKEFGHEIADDEGLDDRSVGRVAFTVWNVEAKKNIWIADPTVEFVLTDRSFETIR